MYLQLKRKAKETKTRVPIEQIKRFPQGPKAGGVVKAISTEHGAPEIVAPAPFDELM